MMVNLDMIVSESVAPQVTEMNADSPIACRLPFPVRAPAADEGRGVGVTRIPCCRGAWRSRAVRELAGANA